MIRREQLVAAISRIDAAERELLWLSLLRRMPDAALARMQGCGPAEVAQRRARAIEHVADELGAQRGEDFGSILTGLTEAETWKPVMPEATIPSPPRVRRRPYPLLWALGGAIAAGAVIAAVVLASQGSGGHRHRATFVPRPERATGRPASGGLCYFTASLSRAAQLYSRPGGPPRTRIPARTPWGSPVVLQVVVRRAAWLGVIAPQLPNGELGWLPAQAARVGCVTWSLDADLSRGLLEVRRARRAVRAVRFEAGPTEATPTGRFAVTDRLQVSGRSGYGCCVLALSGHQGPGSASGARLAVYGGARDASGASPGGGALRASSADVRWLIDNVPVGTPVFIHG